VHFLYNANPAIVAGFNKGFADEHNANKKIAFVKNFIHYY